MQSAKSSFDVDLKIPLHLNKRSECSADPRSSWTNYSVSNSPVTSKWVTITKPGTTETPNVTKTISNTDTIEGEDLIPNNPEVNITKAPSHGTAELRNPNHEYVIYDYTPNSDFNGTDYFEYTVTETIEGCNYTSTGRVTLTVVGSTPQIHDLSQIVTVGDLMWENTAHATPSLDVGGNLQNGQTYDQAAAYCSALELGGFTDWRIPHANVNSGFDREHNELLSIRRQPLDTSGNVWHYVDNSSYGSLDSNSTSIIEPFGLMRQNGNIAYWTDDNISVTVERNTNVFHRRNKMHLRVPARTEEGSGYLTGNLCDLTSIDC